VGVRHQFGGPVVGAKEGRAFALSAAEGLVALPPEKFRGLLGARLLEGALTVRLQNPRDILRME
jgi:hypothetical protein